MIDCKFLECLWPCGVLGKQCCCEGCGKDKYRPAKAGRTYYKSIYRPNVQQPPLYSTVNAALMQPSLIHKYKAVIHGAGHISGPGTLTIQIFE